VKNLSTSAPIYPPPKETLAPLWARYLIDLFAALLALGIAAWAAFSPLRHLPVADDAGVSAPMTMAPCVMNNPGYLHGRLYGSLAATIDWRGPELTCDGMARPNNAGVRLIFASPDNDDQARLIFVIGIDGEPDKLENHEEKANITIIEEGSGRFFSTGGQDRCWTTIQTIAPLSEETDSAYQVDGELYCAGALPSLNGKGSVTLGDFRYSGRLALDDS
jgi:hypothetical protein